jgi:hypothetical protein
MSAQRIILISGSRLLGDMLRMIIYRADHLELVQEVNSRDLLPSAIEESEAEWVIMSLPSDTRIPGWVDSFIVNQPAMRFLGIFLGSSKVKLKSLEDEQDLEDLSLDDLFHILRGQPQHA